MSTTPEEIEKDLAYLREHFERWLGKQHTLRPHEVQALREYIAERNAMNYRNVWERGYPWLLATLFP